MKKLKVLLAVLLMTLCVDVFAASPAKLKDYCSANDIQQGDTITIDTKVVSGNILGHQNVELDYGYDPQILEFVSFETNYDLNYDSNTMLVTKDSNLELDSYVNNEDEAIVVWSMTFKVKDDAKIGETTINGQTYQIIEKSEADDEEVVTEDDEGVTEESIESENNDINIFLITTIVLGVIALIELVYIIVKKNKKA